MRKIAFTIKNEIEAEGISRPKSIGILTVFRCIPGSYLVILAWMGDNLSCRTAQNGITLEFNVKFDLEGQGQPTPKQ